MLTIFGDNIFFDDSGIKEFNRLIEKEYLLGFFKALSNEMGATFKNFSFFIYAHDRENSQGLPKSANLTIDNKVLIYLSEESHDVPVDFYGHYKAIFKTYLTRNILKKNIFKFPLGYGGKRPKMDSLPITERKYNFFYSGNINRNRIDLLSSFLSREPSILRRKYGFYRILNYFKSDYSDFYPDSYIKFTNKFGTGLSSDSYYEYLYNTKVAICPPGYELNHTYRHYEALMAGCIVLSLETDNEGYFDGAPIIQVNNWKDGLLLASNLLKEEDVIKEISFKSTEYFNNHFSAIAVALYVAEKLSSIT